MAAPSPAQAMSLSLARLLQRRGLGLAPGLALVQRQQGISLAPASAAPTSRHWHCHSGGRHYHTTPPQHGSKPTLAQLKARRTTGPFSWKAGLLFVLTGGGMIAYFSAEKARLERERVAQLTKGAGKPKVGGPFELRGVDGRTVTEEDLRGKYAF
ncbi:Cu-binding protein, partial [Ascosphaera acerosa]